MIKVGITGGIGSGKTTICKLFEKLNIPIYYADDRAKEILVNNKDCKERIISLFGLNSYLENGALNKTFLAKEAFLDNDKVTLLNNIIHPLVSEDFENWLREHSSSKLILKEAALLFETGSYKKLDKIIVVDAPVETRIERVLARDSHRDRKQILSIIEKQMPQEEKKKRADYVINNSDGVKEQKILDLIKNINENN